VLRGSAWNNPDNRNNKIGFRLDHYPRQCFELFGLATSQAYRRESMSPFPGFAGRGQPNRPGMAAAARGW